MIKPMKPSSNLTKFLKKNQCVVWSPKFDGVRVLCKVSKFTHPENDSVYCTVSWYSGNGKVLNNFASMDGAIIKYVANLDFDTITLDGEMTATNFSKVMTQLRRLKDIDASVFEYHVFDIADRNDVPLHERLQMLEICEDNGKVWTAPHYTVLPNEADVMDVFNAFVSSGYEGIVVKDLFSMYENKRSTHWCKIKAHETEDVKVVGHQEGTGKYQGQLGALVCERDSGVAFKVGTGFTDEQRKEFWENIPEIIEVSCMEYTSKGRPRHPVFVRVREDKTED